MPTAGESATAGPLELSWGSLSTGQDPQRVPQKQGLAVVSTGTTGSCLGGPLQSVLSFRAILPLSGQAWGRRVKSPAGTQMRGTKPSSRLRTHVHPGSGREPEPASPRRPLPPYTLPPRGAAQDVNFVRFEDCVGQEPLWGDPRQAPVRAARLGQARFRSFLDSGVY
ncbi:hypothetical protein CapIbe_009797 [Capra ibex]